MSAFDSIARRIETSLALAAPAVAVTFRAAMPSGASGPQAAVPAGCSFWELGTRHTIATDAADHRHCAIGIHTHNLAGAPASQGAELGAALAAMQGLDYVRPAEVENLPVMAEASGCVVYGPLRDATECPSVVLLFARAAEGLVLAEALTRVDGGPPMAMGRPACALIPQVQTSGKAASSLGCCGARAYLDTFSDDVALWGLPGPRLEAYADEVEILSKANTVLGRFHELRRADIEAGESPSVEQSLARLAQ